MLERENKSFPTDVELVIEGLNNITNFLIFSIPTVLGPHRNDEKIKPGPNSSFKGYQEQAVQSMVQTENFLVTGTCGEITGWDWKTITSSKPANIKPSWAIQIPHKK